MTIQMKDLSVVQEIAASEMSAVRGGVGGKGLSAGFLRSGMAYQDANEFVFSEGYSFGASNPANIVPINAP